MDEREAAGCHVFIGAKLAATAKRRSDNKLCMGASFERVDTNKTLAATVTIYVVMYPPKGLARRTAGNKEHCL